LEELLSSFSGTITPWLLGILLVLSLIASFAAIKNWREMKRSPYFFQRLQASKRLQSYLATSAFLFVITIGVTAYAWEEPQDTTAHMAILPHSKVGLTEQDDVEAPALAEAVDEETISTSPFEESEDPSQLLSVSVDPFAMATTLPEEFNQLEPAVELSEATNLGALSFSREINDDYEAVSPQTIFPEGFYTLYATFSYDGLADGMVWSWVWRHDGEVVEGGHEVWTYGDEGPGYIYFNPEEGFDSGQYTLQVWVNGEIMTEAAAVMNSVSVSANN
jgi:hypothetical protein